MIDTVSEMLLSGIVRTTLCTMLAALVTLLLLHALGIRSARIHRTAWVLEHLQEVLADFHFTMFLMLPDSCLRSMHRVSMYIDNRGVLSAG